MRFLTAAALAAALAAVVLVPTATAAPPDLPGHTPPMASSAGAGAAVSGAKLRRSLKRLLRQAGGPSGAYVRDVTARRTLYASSAGRRFPIASNMKLFTTATALARIGPGARFVTEVWGTGRLAGGLLRGDLVLRGGGDPLLGKRDMGQLVKRLKLAGLRRITGRVLYDETIFDRKRTVPQHGITGGPYLGLLSGLSFEWGASSNPARSAALTLIEKLRKHRVRVHGGTKPRKLKPGLPGRELLAVDRSARLADLARYTNQPSDNFLAEMMLKSIGAHVRGRGTTRHGAAVVRSFAAGRRAPLETVNGSGLSRSDRASPLAIGRLLASMLAEEQPLRGAFHRSLAVAGRSGTLYDRMRGSAAERRCRGKTGTLTGVSVLSGYCRLGGRALVFSILMNGVDVYRAHSVQDRMVATIARYRP